MVAIIARLLILAFIVWLVRYLLVTIRDFGKPRSKKTPPEKIGIMVKDPVCGLYMDSSMAIRVDGRDTPVYFCSEECKLAYLRGKSGKNGCGGKR